MKADIITSNLGSIWTFTPVTRVGQSWIRRYLCGKQVCEHRFGFPIIMGMLDAGLKIQDAKELQTLLEI